MKDNSWLAEILYNKPSDMSDRDVIKAVINFFDNESLSEQDRFLSALDVNRLSSKNVTSILRSSFVHRERLDEWYFFLHKAAYLMIEDSNYDKRRLVGLILIELD